MTIVNGRVVRDAVTSVVKVNNVDTLVTRFTIAANEGYGEREQTRFFACSIWRDKGAKLGQYLKKGRFICATGLVDAKAYMTNEGKPAAQLVLTNVSIEFTDGKPADPEAPAPEVAEGDETPFEAPEA